MALPNSNISISMVRNELGESSNDLSVLCKSDKINKWSAYKPFVDANPVAGKSSTCGFSIPYTITPNIYFNKDALWSYLKPSGGVNEPFRLGDFRQYDHNIKFADSPFGITEITEAESSYVIVYSYGANSKIASPKNMTFFQNKFAAIQVFESSGTKRHLYTMYAQTMISESTAYAFFLPKSVLVGVSRIIIIPFISEYYSEPSTTGTNGGKSYYINGFDPNIATYKYRTLTELVYVYTEEGMSFNKMSSYSAVIDVWLENQVEENTFLYDTRLCVTYYDDYNGTGNIIHSQIDYNAPQFPQQNLSSLEMRMFDFTIAYGLGYKSVKIYVKDMYRNKTYNTHIFNNE